MEHTSFKEISSDYKMICRSDTDVLVWSYTTADGLEERDTITPTAIGDYFIATITTPDVDCFLLTKQSNEYGVVRVGNPEVLLVVFTPDTGLTIPYKQFDLEGSEIDSGDFTEVVSGFYYVSPSTLDASFFLINNAIIKTLSMPYFVFNCSGGSGSSIDKNYMNVGFNMIGFGGNRYSYFDLSNGVWVDDENVEATAGDLAKAVCYKYGLVWNDRDDDKFIGKYLKYLRSANENTGRVLYYKCGITPFDNENNFPLMQTDEDGNTVIKGVAMLLLQSLESISDTDGAIITFKESS